MFRTLRILFREFDEIYNSDDGYDWNTKRRKDSVSYLYHEGRAHVTYKKPTRKTITTPSFFVSGICNVQMVGIGNSRIAKSVRILGIVCA